MHLVLIGPPGSGKGTQAAMLSQRYAVPVISSGVLMRARMNDGSDLGRQMAVHVDRGELVPDELALAVVRDAVVDGGTGGFILDGFPRTAQQAEQAEAIPELVPDAVVSLTVPDDVARDRMAQRKEGRSDDADLEVIDRRLEIYHRQTEPLLEFYRARGILSTVDAAQSPAGVTAAIVAALGP